jgi:hypothetical protein
LVYAWLEALWSFAMKNALLFATTISALLLGACVATAQPQAAPMPVPAKRCFVINQLEGWRAPDAKTIIIRVRMSDYYRLDLSASCSLLTTPGAHLITKTSGPDTVCSAVDWDLAVSQGPPGNIPEHCIVKAMTRLTPDEVAAIPKGFKP